jgi:hypothetical protein
MPAADILDRLLVTLAVRLHAFSVCQIQEGWRLSFDAFDAITIHYVLAGAGSVRAGTAIASRSPPATSSSCRPGNRRRSGRPTERSARRAARITAP